MPDTLESTTTKQDRRDLVDAILSDRPVAYHPILAHAVRSVTAGVFLSQLLYWTPKTDNKDGWFWKTREEIHAETALTRREQESARRILRDCGVLEEKLAGVPARMWFRLNLGRLKALMSSDPGDESEPTSASKTRQPVGTKRTNWKGGNAPTISETTSETSPETTSSKYLPHPSEDTSFSNRNEASEKFSEKRVEEPEPAQLTPLPRGFTSAGALLTRRSRPPKVEEPPQRTIVRPPAAKPGQTRLAPQLETADHQVIRGYVQDLRSRFRDYASENSSVTRVYRLYEQAQSERPTFDVGTFVGYLEHAASITAERDGELRYLLRVVESLLWPDEQRPHRDTSGYHVPRRKRSILGDYQPVIAPRQDRPT